MTKINKLKLKLKHKNSAKIIATSSTGCYISDREKMAILFLKPKDEVVSHYLARIATQFSEPKTFK
jgi:hypothetical protein